MTTDNGEIKITVREVHTGTSKQYVDSKIAELTTLLETALAGLNQLKQQIDECKDDLNSRTFG